jgi:hypothetical protein
MNNLTDQINHCVYKHWYKKNTMPTTLIVDRDKYLALLSRAAGQTYYCRMPTADITDPKYYGLALKISEKLNHISVA